MSVLLIDFVHQGERKTNYMFNEIVDKYERFSDALIIEFKYSAPGDLKQLEVLIKAANRLNNYQFEKIKLVFEAILSFRFVENENKYLLPEP